jgi:hypothetical protein
MTHYNEKTQSGITVNFGVHQGLALSPWLFIMFMDELSRYCREGLLWDILFANDLIISTETEEEYKNSC